MKFEEVLKVEDLTEGQMKKADVSGRTIDVAKIGGKYYAFDDLCTHEECSLSEGFLDGQLVVCPCHGSKFDIASGEAKVLPAAVPLKTYPVKVENGTIMVCLM